MVLAHIRAQVLALATGTNHAKHNNHDVDIVELGYSRMAKGKGVAVVTLKLSLTWV